MVSILLKLRPEASFVLEFQVDWYDFTFLGRSLISGWVSSFFCFFSNPLLTSKSERNAPANSKATSLFSFTALLKSHEFVFSLWFVCVGDGGGESHVQWAAGAKAGAPTERKRQQAAGRGADQCHEGAGNQLYCVCNQIKKQSHIPTLNDRKYLTLPTVLFIFRENFCCTSPNISGLIGCDARQKWQ